MEGLFEKFSLYDFFNLIITGAVFLVGLHLLGFAPLGFVVDNMNLPDDKVIILATILLLCYIIGAELQGVELFVIEKKKVTVEREMIQTFLNKNSNVIPNKEKLKIYRNEARSLFKTKNIKVKGKNFSREQCEYFFAYCNYYIQVKGENKKTEKMRGIKGISILFTTCFLILFITGVFRIIFILRQGQIKELYGYGGLTITFFVLSVSSYYRMKIAIQRRIRMVMGTYEVCCERKVKK